MADSLKIIIVEDESLIAEMLKLMLEDMGHKVIGVVHTLLSGQLVIERGGYDLAILDINLHGKMEGIELAQELRELRVPFMFLTSYADKATLEEAKKTVPGAYVLKPFTEEDIYTNIEMTMMHAVRAEDTTVSIKDGHKSRILDHEDILFVKADNIYIEVHTTKTKVVSRQTLSAALEKLPEDLFIRVHRSYAVNIKKIDSVSRSSLQIGQVTIPISRTHREDVYRALDLE